MSTQQHKQLAWCKVQYIACLRKNCELWTVLSCSCTLKGSLQRPVSSTGLLNSRTCQNYVGYMQYWDTMAVHDDVRFNPSDKCPDRSNLASKYARPAPEPAPSRRMAHREPEPPAKQDPRNGYLVMSIAPGVLPCSSCASWIIKCTCWKINTTLLLLPMFLHVTLWVTNRRQ